MSKFAAYPALAAASIAVDDLLVAKDTSAVATVKVIWSDVLPAALRLSTGAMIVASSVLSVGANLATNPAFQVDYSASSVATGLKVAAAAAAAGLAVSVVSSGTNENLTIDAKGSGTIALNATGTGNVITTRPVVITSASATAFAVGRQGTTNPGLLVDASTATNVTGLQVKPAAAAAGLDLSVISSGTNENLTINAKGSGTISLNPTGTGNVITTRPVVITSASATAFAVGRQGTTNPGFLVDASTSTNVTGLQVKPAAAAAGCDLSVISSGTDENLTINAKGAGTIALNPTGTGNVITTRPVVVTSASANALAVGRQGTTNPGLLVDASTATSATGIKVKTAAAAGGVAVSVITSGTNEALTLDAAGSGTITLNGTATGNVTTPRGLFSTGTLGVGYATGAGGTVTQATSRTTGVTLSKVSGAITLVSAAGSATPATFTVTNTLVAATDVVIVNQKSGTDLYEVFVTAVAAGSYNITSFTTGGTTTEQPVFNVVVIKGVAA